MKKMFNFAFSTRKLSKLHVPACIFTSMLDIGSVCVLAGYSMISWWRVQNYFS